MNNFFKICLVILIILVFYKAVLSYNDFYIEKTYNVENLSHLIYLLVAIVLTMLISFSVNLFLYVMPFLNNNNFRTKSSEKEKYTQTMVSPDDTYIYWIFSRNNIDIAQCILFHTEKEDDINRLYRIFSNSYLRLISKFKFYFFGIYIRVENKTNNKFEIFANKNLMFLYHKGLITYDKKIFLTDNSKFNQKFNLYPNDITQDFKFLNPVKLDNIVKAAKNINKKFSIIYHKDYIEFYIHNFIFSSNIKNEYQSIMKIIKEFSEE